VKTFFLMPSLDQETLAPALAVARAIADHPFVSSFKVGFSLGLGEGLPTVVRALREFTDKPIVYDHQKAATDIPDTGSLFAKTMRRAGITEAILFPQAGPTTLSSWIKALHDEGIVPVVGAIMTHATYLQSEGGYLRDDFAAEVFARAAEVGVRKFVVPLTKPERIQILRFPDDAVFYSPGFGAQNGDPHAFPAQQEHHLISGRALFAAKDPRAYVAETARALLAEHGSR
jgi:orotidine-5'-phosphate decarboxylase